VFIKPAAAAIRLQHDRILRRLQIMPPLASSSAKPFVQSLFD